MDINRRDVLKGAAALGVFSLLPARLPAATEPTPGWEHLNEQFLLDSRQVYLNNGTLGPSPASVVQSVIEAARKLESNPASEAYGPLLHDAEVARLKLAAFLHCDKDELGITRNTTEAMNEVAQGIEFKPGDHILTTDQEHPGGSVGWEYVARRHQVIIDKVKLSRDDNPERICERFRQAMTEQTRVISFSHVTYTTGCRLPAKEICAEARERNCLSVVDAAQSAGVLALNLNDLGCDAAAGSSHKWLLAPKGTGFLYIRKASGEQIRPLLTSHGMSVYTSATGTRNIPGIIGMGAAVDFMGALEIRNVEKHALQLKGQLRGQLALLPGIQFLTPADPTLQSALISFYFDGRNTTELVNGLRAQNITVRTLQEAAVTAIRISCHCYNTPAQISRLVETLSSTGS